MTIRRTPQDFLVTEVLTESWTPREDRPEGDAHAVYVLEKTSLTTLDAAGAFGRSLGVRASKVSYAGLKDKHAVTRQHVSVAWEKATPPPPTTEAKGWRAAFVGWCAEPLVAEAISVNSFHLIIRDLSRKDVAEMQKRLATLRDGDGANRSILFINYFGEQRFASVRSKADFAGQHLVRGEFEEALRLLIGVPHRKDSGARRALTRACAAHWGKWAAIVKQLPPGAWRGPLEQLAAGKDFKAAFEALPYVEQQFAVEAFQSQLWNECAAALLSTIPNAETLVTPTDFGELIFPAAKALTPRWREMEIPTLAASTRPREPWGKAAVKVLAARGLTIDSLTIPRLRRPAFGEAMRPLVAVASDVSFEGPDADELSRPGRLKVSAKFSLPRGAYATVLLRALGQ